MALWSMKSKNFFALFPSEIFHSLQIMNTFDATHPIIIPLKITGVTSYFDVRKPTWRVWESR